MTRIASMPGDTGVKAPGANRQQSERTPSENKERAYVAASRRGDRSIEARVESAKAASKIHFERTGKRLKISEEIVRKEEMYEEEDDHLPLAYRNVVFRSDIPDKFRDYTMIQLGMRQFGADSDTMAKLDNEDRVNSAFAAAFPGMHGFGQPQRQTESTLQMPLASPGAAGAPSFQRQAGFSVPNEWTSPAAMPSTTIPMSAQSPGLAPFLPEMHRDPSHGSHGMVRTPSDQSRAVMHRNGSTTSIRSARMERQGSGASLASSLSHGTPMWPPPSPGNLDFDGFFAGPLSATTSMSATQSMAPSRSMSVPFPTEPRGNRRRRDEITPPTQSPNHSGVPLVSPNYSIPPAKRNRSDASAYGPISGYPFSREVPGNVQGMVAQTLSAGGQHQLTQSPTHQQNMAYGQFQKGLESAKVTTKTVPRLQPPPRKTTKDPSRAQRHSMSRAGNKESDMLSPTQMHEQVDGAKKAKVETVEEQSSLDTTPLTTTATDAVSPTTETTKVVAEELSPTSSKPVADDAEDESHSFGFLGDFGEPDGSNWGLDFSTEDWPGGLVDAGAFSFDDLVEFPASQPEE